jgi:hypothetical protein
MDYSVLLSYHLRSGSLFKTNFKNSLTILYKEKNHLENKMVIFIGVLYTVMKQSTSFKLCSCTI